MKERSKLKVIDFLENCRNKDNKYKLTPNSENSSYALTFAIFIYYLINEKEYLFKNKIIFEQLMINALKSQREIHLSKNIELIYSKPYLQLLSFTLSAFEILNLHEINPLEYYTNDLFNNISVNEYLNNIGALEGKPGSGNFAMFMAINLIHKEKYLNLSINNDLNNWVSLHVEKINSNGFWGSSFSNPYLQFQNGYHQYEILEYMNFNDIPWAKAADFVMKLADKEGRFAPYPGGGGCYDYDAIFMLTAKRVDTNKYINLLSQSRKSILSSRNIDGGYCESQYIRPRNISNLSLALSHIFNSDLKSFPYVLKRNITLQLNKNNRIKTHWTKYQREWNESDLWDTWFRLLAIARIENIIFNKGNLDKYKFINYPGIGFHNAIN